MKHPSSRSTRSCEPHAVLSSWRLALIVLSRRHITLMYNACCRLEMSSGYRSVSSRRAGRRVDGPTKKQDHPEAGACSITLLAAAAANQTSQLPPITIFLSHTYDLPPTVVSHFLQPLMAIHSTGLSHSDTPATIWTSGADPIPGAARRETSLIIGDKVSCVAYSYMLDESHDGVVQTLKLVPLGIWTLVAEIDHRPSLRDMCYIAISSEATLWPLMHTRLQSIGYRRRVALLSFLVPVASRLLL
jgi:hypothetical protein